MKGAAFARLTIQDHLAAMQGNDVTGDRETQPDAACDVPVVRLLDGHKRLKNSLLLFGRDAPAGIADPEMHIGRRNFATEDNLSTLGKFAGITEQIEQNLPQTDGIGTDERQALGQLDPPVELGVGKLIGDAVISFD